MTTFAVLFVADGSAQAIHCGVWRWPVKTLSDRREHLVNFHPVGRKVKKLRRLTAPSSLSTDTPRFRGIERQEIKIRVGLVTATIEDDHDIHLVVSVPGSRHKTMIVEFPYRRCNGVRSSPKKRQMARARRQVLAACGSIPTSSFVTLHGKATIFGVGFWDEIHGQTGVAPNGVELHPVLAFKGFCRQS